MEMHQSSGHTTDQLISRKKRIFKPVEFILFPLFPFDLKFFFTFIFFPYKLSHIKKILEKENRII